MKKGIKNNRRKKNNFLNETIKRYKSMKDLEKKFYDKEEQMCTFSPKINKNKFFRNKTNISTTNFRHSESNILPIFILPATSRIYCFDDKNKNVKISDLIHSFIKKNSNSTMPLENNKSNNDLKENNNTLNCIYNYSRKKNFNKNNKNLYSLNDIISNNKKNKYNHSYKNINIFEEEKFVPLSKDCYNTFRGKKPKIYFNENNIQNANDLLKLNTSKYLNYPVYDFINNIPKTCRKVSTTLNLLEKNSPKKAKINSLYYLNDKINKIYYNNFTTKNFENDSSINNKRKTKKNPELKRANSLYTNNETRGYSASNSSAKEIHFNKTNSKRDSNRSNLSNFTTFYKSRSAINKRHVNNKNNNRVINPKNDTYITLQSLSDSKILEMAEFFINKREKDDLFDDIRFKKIVKFRNDKNKNKNKNITFSD